MKKSLSWLPSYVPLADIVQSGGLKQLPTISDSRVGRNQFRPKSTRLPIIAMPAGLIAAAIASCG
jgi:hypothetical protein